MAYCVFVREMSRTRKEKEEQNKAAQKVRKDSGLWWWWWKTVENRGRTGEEV